MKQRSTFAFNYSFYGIWRQIELKRPMGEYPACAVALEAACGADPTIELGRPSAGNSNSAVRYASSRCG